MRQRHLAPGVGHHAPRRPDSLRSYLCRIVRNLSIDRWRARRAQRRGGDVLEVELEECLPAAVPSAEEQWELEQVAAAVERWLGRQSARDRALFLRRYFAGWPVGELAGQLGLRPNAAAQRLRRRCASPWPGRWRRRGAVL